MTNLKFITNEKGKTLKDRFDKLIQDCCYFDCLVGYFYLSGFHTLYKSLEKAEKIRILIGIGTDPKIYNLVYTSNQVESINKVKETIENAIIEEMNHSENSLSIEEGIQKFIEMIKNHKLEIKVYSKHPIHAKLYIITFKEGNIDKGRIITGSSNFTQSGLVDNLEFNVELRDDVDYDYAKNKFEELWQNSLDITEGYIQTLTEKTYLKEDISPYQLYLKFLYEYFKDELEYNKEIFDASLPKNFKKFKYQEQAVLNAKRILDEYGGCFISDVVGLGKTYIATMLAKLYKDRILIIAPPNLLKESNPGSWKNVFADFNLMASFYSIGKLDDAIKELSRREYKTIIIDEAHRFRSMSTESYQKIAQICRGKRVILISATPYHNSPRDILSLISLFQNPTNSAIPGLKNLKHFFLKLEKKLKEVDRENNYNEYLKITKKNAQEIRNKVLKYIMIRRTRKEIEKYFASDLESNKFRFPKVDHPKAIFYQFKKQIDDIFMDTLKTITQELTYVRYKPLIYLKDENKISERRKHSQKNLVGFMKVLLVKRLESSFDAFKKSLNRFISYYKNFIKEYKKGKVYISKAYWHKIYKWIEDKEFEKVQQLIKNNKVEVYESIDFNDKLLEDLKKDYRILLKIKKKWDTIQEDPKFETLMKNLKENPILKNNKIIIFTESKDTAKYLQKNINSKLGEKALVFFSNSGEDIRKKIIENFDAKSKPIKEDYQILITTDVLSEGVNLHASNVVINYDIPWNPTRLIQRAGRINRVDTNFEEIFIFNFFPVEQTDSEIELTKIAKSKIEAFFTLLGGDAAILTENDPVSSHQLFDKLMSKDTIIGEEEQESEQKYLKIIEQIKDSNPELFEKIKKLPQKARSAKFYNPSLPDIAEENSLITFFREGKLVKFYITYNKENKFSFSANKYEEQDQQDQKSKNLKKSTFWVVFTSNSNFTKEDKRNFKIEYIQKKEDLDSIFEQITSTNLGNWITSETLENDIKKILYKQNKKKYEIQEHLIETDKIHCIISLQNETFLESIIKEFQNEIQNFTTLQNIYISTFKIIQISKEDYLNRIKQFLKGIKDWNDNRQKEETIEIDFLEAAKIFESSSFEEKAPFSKEIYYKFLEKNNKAFQKSKEEEAPLARNTVLHNHKKLFKILSSKFEKEDSKIFEDLDNENKDFLKRLLKKLKEEDIPLKPIKDILKEIQFSKRNDLKDWIQILKKNIPQELLKDHLVESLKENYNKEIILSLYIANSKNSQFS